KAPSYGLFKTNVTPLYWFGIPRNVKMDGLVMDVDHITHLLAHKNNDTQQWINYNRASGARLSAMEHLVPEQMFSTEDSPANGISAVKALQLAAAEGQKIWTITQTNLDIALNGLQLPASVETDIRNSVYAGKEVTAHEKPDSFFGSSQVGYILLDPDTGAGAYRIGGGENVGLRKKIQDRITIGMVWFGMHSGAQEALIKYRLLVKPLGVVLGVICYLATIWSNCRGAVGVYLSL